VKIEKTDFYGAVHAVHSRSCADIPHAFGNRNWAFFVVFARCNILNMVVNMHFYSINPISRYQFMRFMYLQIGRWESDGAADLITTYHRSGQLKWIAQIEI